MASLAPELHYVKLQPAPPPPRADSDDYVTVSQTHNYGKKYFNGILRQTRDVTISGFTLRLNIANATSRLASIITSPAPEDIENLAIFAETVVVASPIHLPGTNVSIYARELRFEGDGEINTKPRPFPLPAEPVKDSLGNEIKGGDGENGQPAGDVTVNVETITTDRDGNILSEDVPITGRVTSMASWPRLHSGIGGVRFTIAPKQGYGWPSQTLTVHFFDDAARVGIDDEDEGAEGIYRLGLECVSENSSGVYIAGEGEARYTVWKCRAYGPDGSSSEEIEFLGDVGEFTCWIYFDNGTLSFVAGSEELKWQGPAPRPNTVMTRVGFHGWYMNEIGVAPLLKELQIFRPRFFLHGGDGQAGGIIDDFKRPARSGTESESKDMPPISLDELAKTLFTLYWNLTWEEYLKDYPNAEFKIAMLSEDRGDLSTDFQKNGILSLFVNNRVVYAKLWLSSSMGFRRLPDGLPAILPVKHLFDVGLNSNGKPSTGGGAAAMPVALLRKFNDAGLPTELYEKFKESGHELSATTNVSTFSTFAGTLWRLEDGTTRYDILRKDNKLQVFSLGKPETPHRGYDAYPTGTPGNGGRGGTIHSSCSLALAPASLSGGEGGVTEGVTGGKPGSPSNAIWISTEDGEGVGAEMSVYFKLGGKENGVITSYVMFGSVEKRSIQEHNLGSGTSIERKEGRRGSDGIIEYEHDDADSFMWLHPLNIEPAIQFARDAFIRQHRELALSALLPIQDRLTKGAGKFRQPLDEQRETIDALLLRLHNGLDAFGYPAGWVPRLALMANYAIFKDTSDLAYDLLFQTYRVKNKLQEQAEARALLRHSIQSLVAQTDKATQEVAQAHDKVRSIRERAAKIAEAIADHQDSFKQFEAAIAKEAQLSVEERKNQQQTIQGIIKITGSLLKIFPLGQPYLGVAGNLLDVGAQWWDEDQDGFAVAQQALTQLNADLSEDSIVGGIAEDWTSGMSRRLETLKADLESSSEDAIKLQDDQEKLNDEVKAIHAGDLAKYDPDLQKELQPLVDSLHDMDEVKAQLGRKGQVSERDRNNGVALSGAVLEEAHARVQKRIEKLQKEAAGQALEERTRQLNRVAQDLDRKRTDQEGLKARQDELLKKRERNRQAVDSTVTALQRFSAGATTGLQGIKLLATPYQASQAEIKTEMGKLISGLYKEEWQRRARELEVETNALMREKANLLAELEETQATIAENTEAIRASLRAIDEMNGSLVNFSVALDPRLLTYIGNIERDARQRLLQWRYYFAKAYEYRFVTPVDVQIYQLDAIEKQLQTLAETDQSGAKTSLTQADFAEVEKLSMAALRKLGDDILESYNEGDAVPYEQSFRLTGRDLFGERFEQLNQTIISPATLRELAPEKQRLANELNGRVVNKAQIDQLREAGIGWEYASVSFNLRKLGYVKGDWEKARIVSLDLDSIQVVWLDSDHGNLQIEFIHSGESILKYRGKSYLFRHDPIHAIKWGFTIWTESRAGAEPSIEAKERSPWDPTFITQLALDRQYAPEQLASYRPGATSDITTKRTSLGFHCQIIDFRITVKIEHS